jgi:phosphoribosyl 1,2-cyclic phosphodiesterase
MKITFLGTRGFIDVRTKIHYRHTSTLITYKGKRVMIDCGLDWLGKINQIKPDAIILTHAHPDHAWGLKNGAPCPVYATRASWNVKEIKKFPIEEKIVVHNRQKIKICGITFEVFNVIHSLLCPGVGYRITAGKSIIFCVHDLISINARHAALKNCKLYIGDGATILRPMVRRKDSKLFGHTTIQAQLGWCKKEKVPRAIITHCGTQIVAGNTRKVESKIRQLGIERGVDVQVAHDGMSVILK